MDADLTTLEGLVEALECSPTRPGVGKFAGTYCPVCSAPRRMELAAWLNTESLRTALFGDSWPHSDPPERSPFESAIEAKPPVLRATCLQCRNGITLVVALIDEKPQVVALTAAGGLATPNTRPGTAYYVNQAYRAQMAGAHSAALVMYRSALEHLLYQQGFQRGTLEKRIDALATADPAPDWLARLDPEHLHIFRKLGNAAVHVNDGDIASQAAFDAALVREAHAMFVDVLDEVYERPAIKASRADRLRRVVDPDRSPPSSTT